MYTEMALTARRFALTLAVAGIAAMGSVAIAPAASAAPGPDSFMQLEHGVRPIFQCNPGNQNMQNQICIDLDAGTRF